MHLNKNRWRMFACVGWLFEFHNISELFLNRKCWKDFMQSIKMMWNSNVKNVWCCWRKHYENWYNRNSFLTEFWPEKHFVCQCSQDQAGLSSHVIHHAVQAGLWSDLCRTVMDYMMCPCDSMALWHNISGEKWAFRWEVDLRLVVGSRSPHISGDFTGENSTLSELHTSPSVGSPFSQLHASLRARMSWWAWCEWVRFERFRHGFCLLSLLPLYDASNIWMGEIKVWMI